jgi:hypothetical protein
MVAKARGSNPDGSREWDSSGDEAASSKLLDDKKKKGKKAKGGKKVANGIELEPENGTGMSLDLVSML